MRIVGVIPQHMGSRRLPAKALKELAGEPLTYQFIERCKRSELIEEFILTVPADLENDVFEGIAERCGIKFHRYHGPDADVMGRIADAVKDYDSPVIVRLIIDNPMIEPQEIDRIIIHYMVSSRRGILYSNTHDILNNGYPDGLGCEVYDAKTFRYLNETVEDPELREHPHKYFYVRDLVETIPCPEHLRGHADKKLDVNTEDDYQFIKSIYDRMGGNAFSAADYLEAI